MPVNGFNTGHDLAIDILDPTTNTPLKFPLPTGFSAEQITKELNSEPLSDYPMFAYIPGGWKGDIEFDRRDPSVDLFFAKLEQLYWAGVNTINGSILQTIQEQDGSLTQWKYLECALKIADAGKWRQQEKVSLKIDFMARTKLRIT